MKTWILLLICTSLVTNSYAHKDDKHKQKSTSDVIVKEQLHHDTLVVTIEKEAADTAHHYDNPNHITASWSEFPSLHPLLVHFPIVFLLIAFLMQLAGLFVFREQLTWVSLILLVLGFVGAVAAAYFVHPHTSELPERAALVLGEHERYATLSVWLSGIALLLKLVSHFFLKRKFWSELLVAAVMLSVAVSVSIAGHYGAQLVHIEGVGAQGKFLETEHHH